MVNGEGGRNSKTSCFAKNAGCIFSREGRFFSREGRIFLSQALGLFSAESAWKNSQCGNLFFGRPTIVYGRSVSNMLIVRLGATKKTLTRV